MTPNKPAMPKDVYFEIARDNFGYLPGAKLAENEANDPPHTSSAATTAAKTSPPLLAFRQPSAAP